jgi:uncharacterized protein (UPF0276 family)
MSTPRPVELERGGVNTLPYLGLGLSTNAQTDDQPRPFALLDKHPGLFQYLEYSAPLDINQARCEASLFPQMEHNQHRLPLVYHPVHLNLYGPELESVERLRLAAEHAAAIHSPWVSNDVGWWHHRGTPLPGYLYLTPPLNSESLGQCVAHACHVREHLPVPLLLENPAVMTARGSFHMLEFMSRLHQETGCPLLIDIGHLVSHQLANGLSLTEGLSGSPFEAVAQLHIAGGVITHNAYVDDHTQPIRDETWLLFNEIIDRCVHLRAVTYEGDGHPEPVARRTLERLAHRLQNHPNSPRHFSSVAPKSLVALSPEEAWALFDAAHGEPGPERDFRLTVLEQHLDAEVPMARAAVAPTQTSLLPFMTSAFFRAWFEAGERPLGDAFIQWAMAHVRSAAVPGAEALLSLELWARSTWARRGPNETQLDRVFPVDLTEALHAMYSLKRHLKSRQQLDGAGWDGLLQCAARAPQGPWRVRLSAQGRRVVVSPID